MNTLNEAKLTAWLAQKFPNEFGLEIEPIAGGQSNPTWFVNWGKKRLVLRKKPDGPILPGAHAVEREFLVQKALQTTNVSVPKVFYLEEDQTILGTSFYIMERLEGRVFSDCFLPGVSNDERREMYFSVARTLASLHDVKPNDIGLANYGKVGNYFTRQISRWSNQYQKSTIPRIKALDELVEWLPENMPKEDSEVSIAHGDFRIGNMMFHPTEPKVIAVLDWELSTLGHPLADLGFCVMPWCTSNDEYGGLKGTEWRENGIPTLEEFLAEYYENSIQTLKLQPFHVAFALFRFSVIFVGISDRTRIGNAASKEAYTLAPLAERFANRACQISKCYSMNEVGL